MQGMRAWALLAGLFVLGGLAYWFRLRPLDPVPVPVPVHVVVKHVAAPQLTPNQALAAFRGRFHLAPDARFLKACASVLAFPGGAVSPVAAQYQDGRWSIASGSSALGSLPAYPDFPDAMALLRTLAQARLPALHLSADPLAPAVAQDLTGMDDGALMDALKTLDKGYQPGTVRSADLVAAAQALARLAYYEDDKTGTADVLYGEAMAKLALAETVTGKTLTKEEGLLASAMGYSAYAAQMASQLPADDAWRLFIERNDDALEQTARLTPGASEPAYLWLRRLAELDRKQDWAAWYKARYFKLPPTLYSQDTILAMQGQEPGEIASHVLAGLALLVVRGPVTPQDRLELLSREPAKLLGDFDRNLAGMQADVNGPYLSFDAFGAYYRGFLYTSVQHWAIYLLDEWGRPDDAKVFLAGLQAATGEGGRELATWLADKIASEEKLVDTRPLVADLGAAKLLGPALYSGVLEAVAKRQYSNTPVLRAAVAGLAPVYDSRPELRYDYLSLLAYALDIPGKEDIYRSLVSQESSDSSYAKIAEYLYEDDVPSLLRVAGDTHLSLSARRMALRYMHDRDLHADAVRAAYEKLIQEFPTDGTQYADYLQFLQDVKDYDGMIRVARLWLLSQPADKSVFDYWRATDALAEGELQKSEPDAAWSTLVPSLFQGRMPPAVPDPQMDTSGYGASLDLGTRIALARHDKAMADALAQQDSTTYSESLGDQTSLLRVWWTEGRYADAAAKIARWPEAVASWQWNKTLGSTFAEVFGADPEHARQAFQALIDAHIPLQNLTIMVTTMEWSGYPDTAFAMLQEAHGTGMAAVAYLSWSYRLVKSVKGEMAAEAWIEPQLPDAMRDEQCMYFYDQQMYELMWDTLPDPSKTQEPDEVWLLRAAAVGQGEKLSDAQRRSLDAYLAQGGQRWYPTLGRYVLGEDDGKSILDKPMGTRALSEAAYYLALRAASTGDYHAAAEWLNVDLDTGDIRNGEYAWSQELLSNWAAAGQALTVLARKGLLFSNGATGKHPELVRYEED